MLGFYLVSEGFWLFGMKKDVRWTYMMLNKIAVIGPLFVFPRYHMLDFNDKDDFLPMSISAW